MCALWMSTMCRVCLGSDREMYRLAKTPFEETYERVTSGTLVVEGRPCCVCGVCLSALRRCRRFIDTAREANDALDTWIRNPPNTDMLKLIERPLFYLTQTPMEVFEVTYQEDIMEPGLEQEEGGGGQEQIATAENFNKMPNFINDGTYNDESNISTEEIKYEVTSDDENDSTDVWGSDSDKTYISDNASNSLSSFDSINMPEERIDFEMLKQFDEVKINIINLNNVETPSMSNIGRNYPTTTEEDLEKPLLLRRSRKRIKRNEETKSGPILKKRRPITLGHRRGNTDPAVAEHKEQLFSCRQCSYKSADKTLLIAHRKIHTADKQFLCDMCDFKCNRKFRLTRHLMTHTGEKPYACDLCDYKSSNSGNVKRHITTHTGVKRYACDNCDYSCTRKDVLKLHMMKHHTKLIERINHLKSFACHECDYKTWDHNYFSKHLMRHSGQKPFLCDICGYRCILKCNLLQHMKSHTGEQSLLVKQFTCDMCDYKTFYKNNFNMHVKKHTGEKHLTCDMCDYKTFYKNNLNMHVKKHNGEKPITCKMCDYKTFSSYNLKRHVMRHTGEKPFVCDKCDYKCYQKFTLKMHTLTHTGEKPYLCDKCDYKCTEKRTLYKHIEKIHANNL